MYIHNIIIKIKLNSFSFLQVRFDGTQERAIYFLEISWVIKPIQWAREAKHLYCTDIDNRMTNEASIWEDNYSLAWVEIMSTIVIAAFSKKIMQLPAIRTEVCTALGIPKIPPCMYRYASARRTSSEHSSLVSRKTRLVVCHIGKVFVPDHIIASNTKECSPLERRKFEIVSYPIRLQ